MKKTLSWTTIAPTLKQTALTAGALSMGFSSMTFAGMCVLRSLGGVTEEYFILSLIGLLALVATSGQLQHAIHQRTRGVPRLNADHEKYRRHRSLLIGVLIFVVFPIWLIGGFIPFFFSNPTLGFLCLAFAMFFGQLLFALMNETAEDMRRHMGVRTTLG